MEKIFMKQKEIWLVRAPFSNLEQKKVRPMLILSPNNYNKNYPDFIGVYITTNLEHDYSVEVNENDFESGKLFNRSAVRFDTISRHENEFAIKKLGKVKQAFYGKIIDKLTGLIRG